MKASGDLYRRTVLCIDSYEDDNPTGRIYHPHAPKSIAFRSLTQFLLQMEELLNDMDYPQAFTAARCFGEPKRVLPSAASSAAERRGRLATFQIRILFRQNSSWQGSILWQEKGETHSFRSVLDLIRLLDSALQAGAEDSGFSA